MCAFAFWNTSVQMVSRSIQIFAKGLCGTCTLILHIIVILFFLEIMYKNIRNNVHQDDENVFMYTCDVLYLERKYIFILFFATAHI